MTPFHTDQPLQFSPGICNDCVSPVTSLLYVRPDGYRGFIQLEEVKLAFIDANGHKKPVLADPDTPLFEHRHPRYVGTKVMHSAAVAA